MTINTIYGTINDDILDYAEGKLKDFLETHITAGEIFFVEELDITNEDMDSDISDDLFDLIVDYRFDYPERVIALLDVIDEELINIEQADYGEGDIYLIKDGKQWMVLTDDEADEKTIERIDADLQDNYTAYGMDDMVTQAILNNNEFVDEIWFREYMLEANDRLVDDLQIEEVNDEPEEGEYLNRLHKKLVEEGFMDEPEWPEKPEDEDSDEYAEWQAEMENLISEIEARIDQVKYDLVEEMNTEYDTGFEWYINVYGTEELGEVIVSNDLLDTRKTAEYLFKHDINDRGNELNSYSGEEYTADIEYRGSSYTFFIYQLS